MADRIPLARVSAIQGKAFARDQDGNLRQLHIGDVIYEGDVVVTGAGSRVDLASPDSHSIVLRANETLTVDAEVFATVKPDATDAALLGGARDVDRVIKAINEGGSLDALLDETAAGAGTPGGADGGPTFVRLLRIVETVDPLAFEFGTARTGPVDEVLGGAGSADDGLIGLVDAGLAAQSAATAAAAVGSIADVAGTPGSVADSAVVVDTVPIDTVAPSVVVDIVDTRLSSADRVSTVTFTFSDAPAGFTLADITAVGGTLSGLTPTADPKVFTATFTAAGGFTGTGSVGVTAGSYTDAAGDPGRGASDTVAIDTVAPSVVVDIVDTGLTRSDAVSTVTFTFSDVPVGFDLTDVKAVGGTLSGLTPTADPKVFTATFTAADGFTGTGSVGVTAGSYTDAAGDPGRGASDTVAIDTVAPSVVVDIADPSLNSGDKVSTVTFTFSDAPVGFTLADITAIGGTLSGLTPTADPKVFTATFTAADAFTGTGSVAVTAGSYTNLAGSLGSGGSDIVPIDTVAPSVVVDIVDASLNSGDKASTVTFTFSDAPVGFTVADITAVGGTLTGLAPTADPKVFTATFTATDGFTGTGSVSVADASYTDAAGNAGSGNNDSVPIDTVAPSVVVDIVDASLNSADKVLTVSFTFSDAPVGFTLADTTAVGGTLSGLTPTADPKVFTAAFTATDGFTGTGSVSVANASYTDAAGNTGSGNSDTVPIDTVAPSVVVHIVDTSLNSGDKVSTVTFTFSDAPAAFDLTDITAVGGTLSGLTVSPTDPKVYTATFTATDGFTGTGSVSVANASYSDAAGNTGSGNSDTVPIDTVAPSVVVDIVDTSLHSGDKVSTVTFTFSDAPAGFDLTDITAVGGTLSGLTVSSTDPKVYTATFSATDGFTGTGSVSVANASYTDTAGNAGTGNNDTVAIDTVAPSVVVDIVDASLNSGDKVSTVTFTFSDAPAGFDLTDITAVGGTLSGLTVSPTDPKVYTATFTATDGFTGTGSVSVANASYTDTAGNAGTGNNDTVAVDTVAPSVVVDIADPSLNSGDKVLTVTFTFSDAPAGFTLADTTAVGGTLSGLTPTADPKVFTATFTATDGFTGTGSVSVADASYTDAGGNAGIGGVDAVPIDTGAPSVVVDILDTRLTSGDKLSFVTFTFSDPPVGFDLTDITAVGGTLSGLTISPFDPRVYSATFTATNGFTGTGSVAVTAGTYTDAAGNSGGGGSDTVAIDTVVPSVVVDILDTGLNSGDNVLTVSFTFSDAPVGFTGADITAFGGTLTGLTPTTDPKVFSATFTAIPGFTGTGSVSVAPASYTNASGNLGTGNSDTVAIGTVGPSVAVDILDTRLSGVHKVSFVTFTFSDPPVGFDLTDITAVGGTLSALTISPFDPRVYSATFTATDGFTGTASVAVAAGSYTDAAGNTGGGSSDTVFIDTIAPSVVVDIVDASLNSADRVSAVTFTFSDAPVGFSLTDIITIGGTLSGLAATADPKVFTATFTAIPASSGTGSVSVANASYTDAAGNFGTGHTDTVTIDTVAPSVVVDIVDASLNSSDKVSIVTFTFSDAPSGFDLTDITAVGGTLSALTPTADPKVFTAIFTATDGFTGSGSVTVANASYTDAAGNAGSGGTDTVPIDTVAPSVVVYIVDAGLNSADKVLTVTFTFSDAPVGFALADVTAVGGTLTSLTPTADPKVFTATFTATDGFTGPGSVAVTAGSYTDTAGNAGSGDSDTVPIDTAAPSVVVYIVDPSLNSTDKVSAVTFTFSDAPVGFTLADTTAVGGTLSGLTPTADPRVFTATFTATDGFTGTGSVSVANASYTDAAGSPGGGGSDTVPIDTVAPSVVVDIVDPSLNSADKVSTVTFTFSDAPVGFTLADTTAVGGTLTGLTPTADPKVLTATFTATDGFTGTGSVSVADASYTNAAGNPGTSGSDTVPIDTVAPSVVVDIVDASLNSADKVSTVTFTFSDAPVGFTLADTTAVGGTLTGLTPTADPRVFTATLTATDGFTGPGSVAVTAGSYTDAAGNTGTSGSDTVPIDTVAPNVVVDIVDASLNSADKVLTVTFTFSDAPVGFALADTTAVGGTLSGLTPTADPKVFTATFTATDGFTGTGSVAVTGGSYTDAAGNPGTSGSDTVPIDTVAPSVVVDIVDASLNSADKVSTVTFTFSDAPVGFTLADTTAVGGTLSGLTPTADPKVFTATFTATDGFTGTGSVSVADATYTNAAGNAGSGNNDTVPIDTVAPSVVVDIVDASLNSADKVLTVSFTFSDAPVGFTLANTTAVGGTLSGLTPTADPRVFTATFTATDGFTGTGSVSVANASYTDAAGNPGTSGSDTVPIDTVAPNVVVDIVDASLNGADKVSNVTFTFSDAPVGFALADIAAVGGTLSGLTPTADPKVFTATFTATDGFTGTGGVAVTAGSYTDAAGNPGTSGSDTVPIDTVPPSVVVYIVDPSLNSTDKVLTVTFTFSNAPVGFTLADTTAVGGTLSGLTPTADPKVFTATFTATDGFTGPGSVAVTAGSYTDAAGNPGTSGSDTVPIDTVAPSVVVDIVDPSLNSADKVLTVTFTFSDAPVGFTLADTTAVGGTLTGLTPTADPKVFTATFTATDGFTGTGSVSVANASYTDAAGNPGTSGSDTVPIDTVAPSVVVDIVDGSLNSADEVSTVTFTFSDAPVGFTLADTTAVGGTLSGLTPTADPKVFTATFIATDGFTGTGSVSVANASYTDAAGNPGTSGSDTVPIDTVAPSVVVDIVDASLNSADKVSTVTFTFSDAPVGFTLADTTAVGGTLSGLTPTADPKVFTATFTATDGFTGIGSVSVANASYTDAAGNAGSGNNDTVATDTVAPSVVVDIVDASLNSGNKVLTVTFTFSDAPAGFDLTDITAVGGTLSGLTATADPKVFTATFTATDGFTGTGSVSVANASYTDAAGNPGTSGSDTVPIDTVPPSVVVDIVDPSLNSTDKVSAVTFTFSDAPVGFTLADTTAVGGTLSGLTPTADPKVFTATFTATDGFTGPGSVAVTAGSYTDAAGNTGTSGSDTVPIDTVAPSVVVYIVDASLNSADKVSNVTFTFSDAPVGFTLADITAVGGTLSGLTPTADPKVFTATFTATDGFTGTGSVSVADASYTDAAGNTGSGNSDTVPIDTVAPSVVVDIVDPSLNSTDKVLTVTFTFSDAPSGFDLTDITAVGGTLSGLAPTADPKVFTATFTATDGFTGPGSVAVTAGSYTDAAGNPGTSGSDTVPIDTVAPSVIVDIVDPSLNSTDKVSTVTFTFSDAPVGFTLADTTAVGGTLSGLTPAADPKVFTATFTATDGFTGTGSVSVANASYTNAAGNPGTSGSDTVPIDTVVPSVVVYIVDPNLNSIDKVSTVTFTFSDAPVGFALADITAVGGTVSGLTATADPKVFTATFTATDGFTGTGSVSVANSSYTNAAGNPGTSGSDTVPIDTVAPSVVVDIVDTTLNSTDKVSNVTFTFSDAPVGFALADITAVGGTVSGLTATADPKVFTATFTATDGFTGPGSVSVADASYTDTAGNPGTSGSDTVPIDTVAPSVVVNIVDASLNSGDKVSTVTFTFSDAPVGFTLADTTAVGGTLSGLTPTADPKVFTATFTASDGFTGTGSVSVADASYTDAAGNAGSGNNDTVPIDTVAPSVVVDIVDTSLNSGDKVSNVTFTFSDAPVGFTLADTTAVGGTLSGLTPTADPKVFTAMFTATDGFTGTGSVSVANASYTDAAGSPGGGGSDTVPIDTVAPSVVVYIVNASLNSTDKVLTVTFTFSNAPVGFALADITAVGGTVSGLTATADPKVFTATFTATDGFTGTGSVSVADASYTDTAGNTGSGNSDTVPIDTVAPSVVVDIILDTGLNSADKVSIVTFTFSDAPVGFTLADTTAVGGTLSGLTPTADPKVFTATFTATDGFTGPGSVAVTAGSYTDTAGNPGTSGSDTVPIDTVAPNVVVYIVDASLNSADKVSTVTFTFSDAPSGFDLTDITAVGGTLTGLAPTADPKVFTATFTATDGFTGTGSVSVADASYTNAAGNAGSGNNDTVPIDTVAPSVVVYIVDASLNSADKELTVTFTFSDAPSGFDLTDITAVGGTLTGLAPTADPKVFTATFTATDGFTGTGSVSVANASYTDTAGNPGTSGSDAAPVDTVAPSVVVDIVDASLNSADKVSTVTFTFSDAPVGFTLADITPVGGTLSGLTPTADPKVFTATFTATDGFTGTGSVSVADASYTDTAGNAGSGNSDTVPIDTVPPTVLVNIVDPSLNSTDKVSTVTFTFSDAPVGFTLADTTAVGGTLSGLTPTADPKVFTATFTATDGFTGTGSVSVADASYTDIAGSPGTSGSDTVVIDTVAPSVVVDIVDASLNSTDKVSTVTFTFSDAPVGFTLADTTAVGGTLSGLTPTADPKVFTATFTATDGFTGTGSISVADASYTDTAGNTGSGNSDTVSIDTVAPSVVVDIVDASLNSADKVSTVTFTFSDAPVGFTLADTTAVGGTLSGLTPTADPKVFTATFTATDGFTGTGSVSVADASYTDTAGNAGSGNSDTVPIDTVAPSVVVDIVDASLNSADKVSTVTFTFSDAPVGFTLADTTAVGGTLSGLTPTADPKVFTATFTATDGFTGTGSVSVANASYTNAAGNAGSGNNDTVPIDTIAPSVVVNIVDASLNSGDKVSAVTFTFSDAPVGFALADITAVGGTVSGLTATADPKVFTATFTATDGFTGTGSISVADASYTDTAGNTGSGNSDTASIDTVAPSVVVDIVDASLNSIDKVSTVTFTFSDAPVGFALADITAVGGTVSGLTATADPKVFTATFTATDGFTGPGSVAVTAGSYTDAAGNPGTSGSDTVPIDTAAPSVIVDIVDASLNSTDKVSTVTFTFSDAPVGFTLADTTAVGGTLSGLTPTADPKVFTATFTATDGFTGTGSVSVANASYTDAAGNLGTSGSDTVPIDTVAPSVVVNIVNPSLNSIDKVSNVTFTFSDAPVGFTLADTTAVGGTLSGLTPTADPKVFTATFTATDGFTGTGSVSVADASYTDTAGNTGSGNSDTVPIDTVAPSVVVDIVDTTLNSTDKVSSVTFTFSDAPVGFTLADTTAVGGTLSGLTPTADPKVFTATFTATDGLTGSGRVAVTTGSYTDAAGNPGKSGSDTVTIDTAPPVPTITLDASITADDLISAAEARSPITITGTAGGDARAGDTVTLTVNGKTFSGSVVDTAGVLTFAIAVPGADLVADPDRTIDARITTTDAAGNTATATDSESYKVGPVAVADVNSVSELAANTLYYNDAAGNIGTLDPATGARTLVGNAGVVFGDIAVGPTGTLFGIALTGSPNTLYSINPTTAAATRIGPVTGAPFVNSLVASGDGRLFAATTGSGGDVYQLSTTTGAATRVGSFGQGSSGDLLFFDNALYLTTTAGTIRKLDLATGSVSTVVSGLPTDLYNLAQTDVGTFVGSTAGGTMFSIDLAAGTAAATGVVTAGQQIYGFAAAPVGSPLVTVGGDVTPGTPGQDYDPDSGAHLTVTGVAAGIPAAPPAAGVGAAIDGIYGKVVIAADGSYSYTLDNSRAAVQRLGAGEVGNDVFTYRITDADGGVDTATLTVQVNGAGEVAPPIRTVGTSGNDVLNGSIAADSMRGDAGNDTMSGGLGADTMIGGAGNDLMSGGLGADVFQWRLADRGAAGTPAADTVTDFSNSSRASGGDVLDLRDLLQGENSSLSSLDNYLHFDVSAGGTTVQISSSGGFASGYSAAAVDQQVVLAGVDLSAGGLTTDQLIIQDLLTKGKLITD